MDTSEYFHEHVKALPQWKSELIQHSYTRYPTYLFVTIQHISPIFIATEGSKSETKSGGALVISTPHVKLLAHGSNPDYSSMDNVHFYRSEAYAMLSIFIFLN